MACQDSSSSSVSSSSLSCVLSQSFGGSSTTESVLLEQSLAPAAKRRMVVEGSSVGDGGGDDTDNKKASFHLFFNVTRTIQEMIVSHFTFRERVLFSDCSKYYQALSRSKKCGPIREVIECQSWNAIRLLKYSEHFVFERIRAVYKHHYHGMRYIDLFIRENGRRVTELSLDNIAAYDRNIGFIGNQLMKLDLPLKDVGGGGSILDLNKVAAYCGNLRVLSMDSTYLIRFRHDLSIPLSHLTRLEIMGGMSYDQKSILQFTPNVESLTINAHDVIHYSTNQSTQSMVDGIRGLTRLGSLEMAIGIAGFEWSRERYRSIVDMIPIKPLTKLSAIVGYQPSFVSLMAITKFTELTSLVICTRLSMRDGYVVRIESKRVNELFPKLKDGMIISCDNLATMVEVSKWFVLNQFNEPVEISISVIDWRQSDGIDIDTIQRWFRTMHCRDTKKSHGQYLSEISHIMTKKNTC